METNYCPNAGNCNLTLYFKPQCLPQPIQTHSPLGAPIWRAEMVVLGRAYVVPDPPLLLAPGRWVSEQLFNGRFWTMGLKSSISGANQSHCLVRKVGVWKWGGTSTISLNPRKTSWLVNRRNWGMRHKTAESVWMQKGSLAISKKLTKMLSK